MKVDSGERELAWRHTKLKKKRDKSAFFFFFRLECTGADGTGLNAIEIFDIDLRFRSKLCCFDCISWLGLLLYILHERTRLAN